MRKRMTVVLASVAVVCFVPRLSLGVASASDPYPCGLEVKDTYIECNDIKWTGASFSSIEYAVAAALGGAEEYLRKNVDERIEIVQFEIKELTGKPWKWMGILAGGGDWMALFMVELEITYFVAVEYPRCEDGNPCTDDVYDPSTGMCIHEKVQSCSFSDSW